MIDTSYEITTKDSNTVLQNKGELRKLEQNRFGVIQNNILKYF